MSAHPTAWHTASDKNRTPPSQGRKHPPSDFDRPEPTEEIDGDDIISDWSYDPTTGPPPDRRRVPPREQTRRTGSPHSF